MCIFNTWNIQLSPSSVSFWSTVMDSDPAIDLVYALDLPASYILRAVNWGYICSPKLEKRIWLLLWTVGNVKRWTAMHHPDSSNHQIRFHTKNSKHIKCNSLNFSLYCNCSSVSCRFFKMESLFNFALKILMGSDQTMNTNN